MTRRVRAGGGSHGKNRILQPPRHGSLGSMKKRVQAVRSGAGSAREESAAVQGCRQRSLQLIKRHGRLGSMVKTLPGRGGRSHGKNRRPYRVPASICPIAGADISFSCCLGFGDWDVNCDRVSGEIPIAACFLGKCASVNPAGTEGFGCSSSRGQNRATVHALAACFHARWPEEHSVSERCTCGRAGATFLWFIALGVLGVVV